ncbi:MAG: GDSL-type esterase/lipase family protein [Bryobacter sp.]|nr:GDSL-type esterase/lipase family protein [Bryobacter sp.]
MTFPARTSAVVLLIGAIVALGWGAFGLDPARLADRLWSFSLRPYRTPPAPPPLPIGKNYGKLVAAPKVLAKNLPRPALRLQAGPGGVQPIEDESNSLAPFYQALGDLESHQSSSPLRIAHYGDSPTTADLITADVRELLQRQYGNAGHGFHLIAKPWAWYGHRSITSDASGWDIDPATTAKVRDGLYGYGAVSFRGGTGARARLRWKGAEHTRATVAYFQQPNGGAFRVEACGEALGETETNGEAASRFASFPLSPACPELTLRVSRGPVRLYGLDLLSGQPGIVYDSLGINGAYISVLSKLLKAPHWAEQLAHFQPALVIVNYGTNESVYEAFVDKAFEKELRETIRRLRAALPGKSILVMSPMDRGQRNAAGAIETVAAIEKLIAIEQKVAAEESVAFFNTFAAMGGNGTMRDWYEGTPRLVGADFIHPMPAGAKRIGEYLFRALQDGFNRHKNSRLSSALASSSANSQN